MTYLRSQTVDLGLVGDLSARDRPGVAANGFVAVKIDLDGVAGAGVERFLAGAGGHPKTPRAPPSRQGRSIRRRAHASDFIERIVAARIENGGRRQAPRFWMRVMMSRGGRGLPRPASPSPAFGTSIGRRSFSPGSRRRGRRKRREPYRRAGGAARNRPAAATSCSARRCRRPRPRTPAASTHRPSHGHRSPPSRGRSPRHSCRCRRRAPAVVRPARAAARTTAKSTAATMRIRSPPGMWRRAHTPMHSGLFMGTRRRSVRSVANSRIRLGGRGHAVARRRQRMAQAAALAGAAGTASITTSSPSSRADTVMLTARASAPA